MTPRVAVWLGCAAPVRSMRWLDGAIAAGARLGAATVVAAGAPTWLDLAAERATRTGLASAGVATDLLLDYLGWAHVVAAIARQLEATTVLVDEASRPERTFEVAAIAELLGAAQLTHVVAIAPDPNQAVLHASRIAGNALQSYRVRGTAVLGVRIASAATEPATPAPGSPPTMRRLDLAAIGVDPIVLGHRTLPPSVLAPGSDRIAEQLAAHVVARGRP